MTLWSNVAAVQFAVQWQAAHLAGDPKRPLWTVSAWQLAQVVPAARKLLSRWQLAQATRTCAPVSGKAGSRMAEARRRAPPVVRMAAGAIAAERAAVDVLGLVAADAGHRRLEAGDRADVARGARHAAMRAAQREAGRRGHDRRSRPSTTAACDRSRRRCRWRRDGRRPGDGRRRKSSAAAGVPCARRGTRRRRPPHGVRPAGSGCGRGRSARPSTTQRRMATGAVAAVGAFVDIVLEVAGDALARRAGERPPTWQAAHGVFWCAPIKGKPVTLMVECADDLPAGVIMATGAIAAEAPLMGVVLRVAGDAGVAAPLEMARRASGSCGIAGRDAFRRSGNRSSDDRTWPVAGRPGLANRPRCSMWQVRHWARRTSSVRPWNPVFARTSRATP